MSIQASCSCLAAATGVSKLACHQVVLSDWPLATCLARLQDGRANTAVLQAPKGVCWGQALQRSLADLPPMWAEKGAVWCDDYDFRVGACARTWLRPHAQDNLMCAVFRAGFMIADTI